MKRRDFIKAGVTAGMAAGSLAVLANPLTLLAAQAGSQLPPYDLVAVRGGEPDVMFRRAIAEIGGMGRHVRPGQSVVVKPNIGWDLPPERGGNTHPLLVGEIVAQCIAAGAKEVYVLDHTCDVWKKCYRSSGIEEAVNQAGGKVISAGSRRYYKRVAVGEGKRLKEAEVHGRILNADVLINVPILKHHVSTRLSLGMKNMMGAVWDRRYWHSHDLHQCIADFSTLKIPDLTVMDAYYVIKQNGPRGVSLDDVITLKAQIISKDPVAVDSASAKMFGISPDDVGYIRIADRMNVGTKDLSKLSIKKIKL